MSKTPLAIDAEGKPLSLPESAIGWRVRRKTGGRPSTVLGDDGEPLTLDLETTAGELAALLGPGKYRLAAVDDDDDLVGVAVDHEVLGELASLQPYAKPRPLPGVAGTEAVLAQALVDMARSHAEVARTLATSQAEWIKALAATRSLPKTVAVPFPAAEPRNGGETPAALSEPAPVEPSTVELALQVTNAVVTNIGPHLPVIVSGLKAAFGTKPAGGAL
jgi:hypothetical protein